MRYKCKLKLIESTIFDTLYKCEIRLDYKIKGSVFYKSKYIFKVSVNDTDYQDDNYINNYEYFGDKLNEFLGLGAEGIMEFCKECIKDNEQDKLKEINAIDNYKNNKSKVKKLFKSFEIEVK
ncbi:MAG: hypothetical protein ACRDD7_07240 [Peptostreptococcaceae bacterium]